MPAPALHSVFQSTAIAKITYAIPAWLGFTNAADRNRLEAFVRRAIRHGFCSHTTPTLSSLSDQADQHLFAAIATNDIHPLHTLLPPKVHKTYNTRPRSHCYELPAKTSVLNEHNFFYRLLHRDILSYKSATHWYCYLRLLCGPLRVAISWNGADVCQSVTCHISKTEPARAIVTMDNYIEVGCN